MDGFDLLMASICITGLIVACCRAEDAPAPSDGAIADRATYLQAVREEMQKQWPSNRTVNIVCHGHSVPAGYFQTPVVNSFQAYPHLLHKGLKERYPYAVINVIVTAIGGGNSESGAARFDGDVLAKRPDVLLIDYSLNDRPMGLERARKAWVEMIEKALAANVKVLLVTPTTDMGIHLDDPEDPANQHAEQVRALAREYGVGLVDSLQAYHDYEKAGGQRGDLLAQYNHPNEKGHELVAKQLLPWFTE